MFAEFNRVAKMWDPDWIVIENVKGILETLRGFFLRAMQEELRTLGYHTSTMTLNASDHGVPQRRARTFVVGSKDGTELSLDTVMNGSALALRFHTVCSASSSVRCRSTMREWA